MRHILFIIFSFCLLGNLQAQRPGGAGRFRGEGGGERIESLRIAYITRELNLSAEEAQQFWPLYNDFREKQKNANDDRKGKRPEDLNDSELEGFINAELEREAKVLQLRREFVAKVRKVIPLRKVVRLLSIEREFQKRLLKRLQDAQE